MGPAHPRMYLTSFFVILLFALRFFRGRRVVGRDTSL